MLRFNGETSFFTQLVIRHPYRTLARQGGERSGPCRNVRVTELCEVKGDVPYRSRRGSNTEHTPLPTSRPADSHKTRVKGKRSQPGKKMVGTIPAQTKEENWHAPFHNVLKGKSPTSTALRILTKSTTSARKQNPNDMSEYTSEMVPHLVGRIAEFTGLWQPLLSQSMWLRLDKPQNL